MVNRFYRKGYLFEKKTVETLKGILSKYPDLLYYIIESRGSHGIADIVLLVKSKVKQECFAIQCKSRKHSERFMLKQIEKALERYGIYLYFAYAHNGKVVFYPDLIADLEALRRL